MQYIIPTIAFIILIAGVSVLFVIIIAGISELWRTHKNKRDARSIPSYSIIRRACADGVERWQVMIGKMYLVRNLSDSGSWSMSPRPIDERYPCKTTWSERATAESVAREHWQDWLSEQELFTEELHFDPEEPVCAL